MIGDIFRLYVDRWEFFSELLVQHIILTVIAILFITVIGLKNFLLFDKYLPANRETNFTFTMTCNLTTVQ